ncbi:MAG TPA: methyl-accepting chemotaxis protein [Ruminiclostridium sp.]|nr:methyl-accepting chemotaxis protein [Ruminiclostridium sp.]
MENNAILSQNEIEANKFAAKVMMGTNGFVVLVYVLNMLKVFSISVNMMTVSMLIAAAILSVPFVIVYLLKQQAPWVKYVSVTASVLMVATLTTILNFHIIVIFAYPLAISSLFFSRRLSIYTTVLSVSLFTVAQLLNAPLNGVEDLNMVGIYDTVAHGIVPRSILLILLAYIFVVLSKRTHNMLANIMGAHEQEQLLNKTLAVTRKSADVSNVIARSVENLSMMTEGTTKANEGIAESTARIAEGSKNSLRNMEEASSSASEMKTALDKISQEGRTIGELSMQINKLTNDSGEVLGNAVEEMTAISNATRHSKEIISRLEQRSGEIANFVEVITQISSQTNLLALNAAIESARAGEQGKGFAVVAQEIRSLAEGSQKAAKDISLLIKDILGDTGSAVVSMDNGCELVERGLQVINEARESFEKVSAANNEMNSKLVLVNTDSEEAVQLSNEVVEKVVEVTRINNETLENLEHIAAASEELVASMQELDSSVDCLKNTSNELLEISKS